MKRAALKRKTPMPRASKPMARSSKRLRPVRAKKAHPRPVVDDGFGEDYLRFVASHPCCMAHLGGCFGDVVAHHHRRGEHRRVHRKTVPLCYQHHSVDWHQHGCVRPMTTDETVVVIEAEIERLNEDWRQAA